MVKGEDGVIISATEKELYSKYLNEEYYKQLTFKSFLAICQLNGIKIEEDKEHE